MAHHHHWTLRFVPSLLILYLHIKLSAWSAASFEFLASTRQIPNKSTFFRRPIISRSALSNRSYATLSLSTHEEDHEDLVDRDLCFGGVGRLYEHNQRKYHGLQSFPHKAQAQAQGVHSSRPSHLSEAQLLDRLQDATVVIVGVGGVGSWAAEALCRSGVGNLFLIDLDDVCRSNINRQIQALHSTVGQMKIQVLQKRLQDISPSCKITCVPDFVTASNVDAHLCNILLSINHDVPSHSKNQQHQQQHQSSNSTLHDANGNYNHHHDHHRHLIHNTPRNSVLVVLDASDASADKAALVAACVQYRIPLVVCGGAAGRTDPTCVTVADLTRAQEDRLLQSVRRDVRKHYGFPAGAAFRQKQRRSWRIPAVYSTQPEPRHHNNHLKHHYHPSELVMQPSSSSSSSVSTLSFTTASSSLRRCDNDFGTACFVTGTFGMVAAGYIVDMIVYNRCRAPAVRVRAQVQPTSTPPLTNLTTAISTTSTITSTDGNVIEISSIP